MLGVETSLLNYFFFIVIVPVVWWTSDFVPTRTTFAASAKVTTTDKVKQDQLPAVTYSQRSFIIHGKPTLLFSGSVHYTRVPPSDWNRVFQLAKELGLNCIQTYVIWSEHEPVPGNFHWEGYGDLLRFIDLAAANGLYVVVRIGPYICGEYYFGGIPLWVRHASDLSGNKIECFRCTDPIWKREMQRWVSLVVDKLQPHLASSGGSILWMQIENEYNPDDEYLEWSVAMSLNATADVPWGVCGHQIHSCMEINKKYQHQFLPPFPRTATKKNVTNGEYNRNMQNKYNNNSDDKSNNNYSNKILCTINGFWMEEAGKDQQPGPEFFQMLWPNGSNNLYQPAIWTEDQGWFDIWGMAHRVRWTSDQLYGVARFVAYGGSYHNFYMLTGGNNYGLRAGRDATTAYASDTVIDNLLIRHEPRFSTYRDFFHTLRAFEGDLLSTPVPVTPIPLDKNDNNQTHRNTTAEAHEYGNLVFLSNFGETHMESGYFQYRSQQYFLSNHTVVIINISSSVILFNTSKTMLMKKERDNVTKKTHTMESVDYSSSSVARDSHIIPIANWSYFQEKVGYGAIVNGPQTSPEQLNITNNDSDYMWYTFYTSDVGNISVKTIGWGGLHYIYVDGVLSNSITKEAEVIFTKANRGRRNLEQRQKDEGSRLMVHHRATQLNKMKKVDILSVAMGLANYAVSPKSGKGIESVIVGEEVGNCPHTKFVTAWKLKGEELEIYTDEGSRGVIWHPIMINGTDQQNLSEGSKQEVQGGLLWFHGNFQIPNELLPFVGKQQPHQTALVANLRGLHKGMAYINGFNIGRYWLVAGQCHHFRDGIIGDYYQEHDINDNVNGGDCAPPRHGKHCYLHWKDCKGDTPTQHLYHIPFEVLKPSGNTITLFEETSPQEPRNLSHVWLEIVHNHPA